MPHVDDGTLHALLDGALRAEAPERADRVEAHLDGCADCRARLEAASALRDEASAVLGRLDAGVGAAPSAAPELRPDFQEVRNRAAAVRTTDEGGGGDDAMARRRLTWRLRWTRGLGWAATIVVALGTGYLVRDLAGPTGEVPRTRTEPAGARPAELAPVEAPPPEPMAAERAAPRGQPAPSPSEDAAAVEAPTGTAEPEAEAEPVRQRGMAENAPAAPDAPAEVAQDQAGLADTLAAVRTEALAPVRLDFAPSQPSARSAAMGAGAAGVRARAADQEMPGIVGCYALELGEWSPPLREGEAPHQVAPGRFRLTDSVGVAGAHMQEAGRLLVRPVIEVSGGHPPMGRPGAFWRPVSPDSVRVIWTNGFVGLRLDLAVRGDTLDGRARATSDGVVPGAEIPSTTARAVRVACPEPGGG